MLRDTSLLPALVGKLERLDVALPEGVPAAAHQLLRVPSLLPDAQSLLDRSFIGLSDADLTQTLVDVGVAVAFAGSAGPGATAQVLVGKAMAEALADAIVEEADAILDQLRPTFDEAGEAVHNATKLGINPLTTDRDIVKADDIEAMRDAWTALPQLTRTLDEISAARIMLTQIAGVPPTPRLSFNGRSGEVNAGAMFRDDAPSWRHPTETTWQMWLRLCAAKPVSLLGTREAVKAAEERA